MSQNLRWWLRKGLSGLVLAIGLACFLSPSFAEPVRLAAAMVAAFAGLLFVDGRRILGAQAGGQYLDLPAGNAALKELYDDPTVENLAYDDNPALVMIPKKTDATGKYIPIPVIYEVSQGRSSSFANAQGNQTPMLLAEFLLTLKPDYAVATLGQQAMLASADDKGSFVDFAKEYVDIAIQGAALSAASSQYRAGTGSVSQISSITGGVITLTDPADIAQFGINQTVQANITDGGAPRAALGYVIGRNVIAGTVTVSNVSLGGPAGSPTSWAANDFLLVQGDNNSKMSGWAAWLPATAPSSTDNFYGVNRSIDSRLYGLAYPGQSQPNEEALIDSSLLVRREKGRPKHFFTNYGSLAALIKSLGARREFTDWTSEDGVIGFRGVKVQGPDGVIEVFADRNCPARVGYLVQLNKWKLYSLKAVPHIFRPDGLDMLRLGNADAVEVRAGYYGNFGCKAPGWNSQVALQT